MRRRRRSIPSPWCAPPTEFSDGKTRSNQAVDPGAVRRRTGRVPQAGHRPQAAPPPAAERARHPVFRGLPDHEVPSAGDAAGGAHLRGGRNSGGIGRLQPAHPGRRQLEGHPDGGVPGRGGAPPRLGDAHQHGAPGLDAGGRRAKDFRRRQRGPRALQ